MNTHIVLLRGVMPTGRNRVPMAALREALSAEGLQDVRTYIQSGNVIVSTSLTAAEVNQLVETTITARIGASITALTRSPIRLREVLAGNPFSRDDAERTYFSFLANEPDTTLLAAFRQTDFSPDHIVVAGDVLYTRYATRLSDSKFTNNYFERKLKTAATTRNFNTLTRLIELTG